MRTDLSRQNTTRNSEMRSPASSSHGNQHFSSLPREAPPYFQDEDKDGRKNERRHAALRDHPQKSRQLRRVIGSCMVGNAMEWYDFALYGYFATLLGELFFPASDALTSLMATFGVFAAGFIMRPLGGIIFGHIGDRSGRKKALLWSVYLMAFPTAVIGLLPTYEVWGLAAPLLLTLIRLLQGLSMGGEFTGSMIFMVENAPKDKRYQIGSWAPFSLLLGILIGSSLAALISAILSPEAVRSWGWRVPFLLSIVGGFAGTLMRRTLDDEGVLDQSKKDQKKHTMPLAVLFQYHKKALFQVLLVDMLVSVGFYLIVTFIVSYLEKVIGLTRVEALAINTLSMVVFALTIPVAGRLADRWGSLRLMGLSSLVFALFSIPLFHMLVSKIFVAALLAHGVLALLMGIYFAPIPALLVGLFPSDVRYSGLSLSHNLSMAFFGGTAPWVVTYLIQRSENISAPSFYLCAASSLAFFGILWLIKESASSHDQSA